MKSRTNTDNLAEKKRSMYDLRLSMLEEDPENIRKEFGDLDSLARDIAVNGVRMPLRVRRKGRHAVVFVVTDGNRRLRASRMAVEKYGAQLKAITCQIEDVGEDDATRLFTMLATGTHGKPLTPQEEGAGYRKALEKFGVKIEDIARRVGRSVEYVRGCLAIDANPEAGHLSPTAAAKLSTVSKAQAARVLASGARTAREVTDAAKGRRAAPKRREIKKLARLWSGAAVKQELSPEAAGFLRGLEYALGKAEAMTPEVQE